jgi:hypothetical protein
MRLLRILLMALGFGSAAPGSAHHAFTAQYDATKTAELTGVVVKIEWLNPHTYFFVDVDTESGEVETWAIEMGSPVSLMRRGWTRNSMQIGDVVTIDGALARDGSTALNARSVVLQSTGQRLFSRSPSEDQEASAAGR